MADDLNRDNLTVRTSWLVAGKTLAFAFTIAIPLLLVRRMAPHEFGLYKQIFLVVNSAVTMLPLGFGMTAFYFLPREREHRAGTVLNIVLLTASTAALFALVLLIYPRALVLLFREPAAEQYAAGIAAVTLVWVVGSVFEAIVVANHEVKLASAIIVGTQLTRAAVFVIAAAWAGTIRSILVAAGVHGVLQLIALLAYLGSRFPRFWRAFDRSFLWRQLSYALPFAAAGLLYTLQTDVHNYFVSQRFGPTAYAIYSIGCFQLPLFGILAESIGSVMIPRCSALQREGDARGIVLLTARAMRKLAIVYWPAYVFLLIVRREFIVGLFSERYAASVPVFAINLTLIPLGIFVLDPVIRAYSAHRHFPMKLHASLLLALVLTLPAALDHYGLVGAIGVVIVVNAVSRLAGLIKVARVLGAGLRDLTLLVDVVKAAAAAAAAGVIAALARAAVAGQPPLVVVALCGIAFTIAYAAAAVAIGVLNADERALAVRTLRHAPAALGVVPLGGAASFQD